VSEQQGLKYDNGKDSWVLLMVGCRLALRGALRVLMMGARKYGPNNWQGVEWERYLDAQYRHLDAIAEHGLLAVDEESKELHAHHVTTNAMFIAYHAEQARGRVLHGVPHVAERRVAETTDAVYPCPTGTVPRREAGRVVPQTFGEAERTQHFR
jgi:hypothetical protein